MKYADIIIPGGADNNIGFKFILENLKNHQKSLASKAGTANRINLVPLIVLSDAELKKHGFNGVFYSFDPSSSHSSLMIEGLIIKYTHAFFEAAISYWEGRVIDKIKERLSIDLNSSFENIKNQVSFCSLSDFLMNAKVYGKDANIRTIVVYEPFLFTRKVDSVLEPLQRIGKKLTKPVYFASLMNEVTMIENIISLSPMARLLMHFCLINEDKLFQTIKVDEQGQAIDEAKIRQVFVLVNSSAFLERLRGSKEAIQKAEEIQPSLQSPELS